MMAQIRSIWSGIQASYWFYPALFAVLGFFLALGLVYLDRTGAADWLGHVTWYHASRPQGASNMLTVLAGSMIGVASTVFSITIAAVAYASGTYGPRLLTNFMEDKGNQLSLATFIGTFVYAITVLRTVRTEEETPAWSLEESASDLPGFVPQLSLLVSFGLMVIAVGVLVYFLHHIPSSIRINSVLEGIGKRLLGMIEKRFPDKQSGKRSSREAPEGPCVTASHTGYVRVVEIDRLKEIAQEADIMIGLRLRAGDFVHPGKPLVQLDRDELDEATQKKIRSCFALGGSRTPEQDLEFSIDELAEIALRALSPGINDPFTAISAVHWLGAATSQLGQRRLDDDPGEDEEKNRIVVLADGFDHFLQRGFGAARSALATSKLTALVALESLHDAALLVEDATRAASLAKESDLLMAQAELALRGPELEEVRARHIKLSEERKSR